MLYFYNLRQKKRFIQQAAQGYIPEETLTRCSFADAIKGGLWSELSFKDRVPVVLLCTFGKLYREIADYGQFLRTVGDPRRPFGQI